MIVTVKHLFQSAKADSADGTLVQPSHWNQDHNVIVDSAVESVFGRTGIVTAQNGDYNINQITDAVTTVFGRKGAVTAQPGDYNASQVTNAVSVLGSYADPPWITSLSYAKLTGAPVTGVSSVFGRSGSVSAQNGDYTAAQVTNAVSTLGSYPNPSWITSLDWGKITGAPSFVVDPTTTKGDLLARGVSNIGRLPAGSNGLVLMTDSAQALGLRWGSPGAAFQTPWLSNIDGAGFNLSNVSFIESSLFRSLTNMAFSVGSGYPERMFITTGGFVGIGTSNPQANLHINTAVGSNSILRLESDATHAPFIDYKRGTYQWWVGSGLESTNNFSFYDVVAASLRMVIRSDGNVGIGTANPQVKLSLGSASAATRMFALNDEIPSHWYGFGIEPGTLVYSAGSGSPGSHSFRSGDIERMRINFDGNVGIGTTSPGAKLDVQGNLDYQLLLGNEISVTSFEIGRKGSAGTDAGYLRFYGRQTGYGGYTFSNIDRELMRIMPGGNVGINTTNPQKKLDVTGDFRVTDNVSGNVSLTVESATGYHGNIDYKVPVGANASFSFYSPTLVWTLFANATTFVVSDNDGLHGVQMAQHATAWTAYSDEREKNIKGRIPDALQKVLKLSGVEFSRIGDDLRRVGLIAQEVDRVLPEAVDRSNPERLGVRYTEVIPLLVEAIRELAIQKGI